MSGQLFPNEEQLCKARILIIDDEEVYTRVLEWVLTQAKFPNFKSLTKSTHAQEEFERFKPDLVLLDLYMPEVDGFTVLQHIRKTVPDGEFLPVLVLTGDNTSETRNRALAAGATDFLGKPVDYSEVMLRIKNLLQTRFLYQQAREIQTQLEATKASDGKSG